MATMSKATEQQPDPKRGGRSCTILVVADLMKTNHPSRDDVIRDLIARDELGFKRYGQNLETDDGRDTLADWYQELLDACQYGRKYLEEKPHKLLAKSVYEQTLMLTVRLASVIRRRDNTPRFITEAMSENPLIRRRDNNE
jgi:hypothetical protein